MPIISMRENIFKFYFYYILMNASIVRLKEEIFYYANLWERL